MQNFNELRTKVENEVSEMEIQATRSIMQQVMDFIDSDTLENAIKAGIKNAITQGKDSFSLSEAHDDYACVDWLNEIFTSGLTRESTVDPQELFIATMADYGYNMYYKEYTIGNVTRVDVEIRM